MPRLPALLLLLIAAIAGYAPALAEPADIDAAARGVVRVVIIGTDGEQVVPLSHGTGFAVSPRRVATNAHVVRAAAVDDALQVAVVPPDGAEPVFARLVAVSPGNDLALLELGGNLRLPPLTIAGSGTGDSGDAVAVGYPMSVDRAQGLSIGDLFRPQPPVKSRGALAGSRPSRQFDTLLHTAPIARGSSGGPLLDPCGRVLGVNSFGAEGEASDAEFFFAVSTLELVPFLRANGVSAQVTDLPCRSLSELDEAEQLRSAREQAEARSRLAESREAERERRERARLEAAEEVQTERENAMALAFVLVLVALGAGLVAWKARSADAEADPAARRRMAIAGAVALVAVVIAAAMWFTRPGLDEIDRRTAARLAEDSSANGGDRPSAALPVAGALVCSLDPARSRATGAPERQVTFEWDDSGCINGRTQYGLAGGEWARVFVPNEDEAVSVSRFDPGSLTYRVDRFLLGRADMVAAREARGQYTPPACGSEGAATRLGDLQGSVTALLPARPNERLVYTCRTASDRPAGAAP